MINISNAFREKLEAGEPVRMVVDITFPDGTKKTINKDIMNGGNGFSDCAESSSFPVGATVCKTLTLNINNDQEQWKNYNFYGAKIHAYLKLQTSYAAPESVSALLDESYNPILDSTDSFVSLPGWTINAEGFLALTSGPGSDVQRLMAYANPPALSSDDIVITGIRLKNGETDNNTDTDHSGMYGEEGYVLELENELIDSDQLQTVANIIGEQIVGARFRNLEGDLVYNPLVEFGDMVYTYDRLGNKYLTPLTDVSGNVGGLTTVKTQTDDPIRGSSDFYGNSTKAIVAARQMVQKETSAREEAIQRLAEMLNSSSGLYMTQEPQQDGSIIYYMHNKATIAESNIIWKLTAEAFAVSIDGGKTYP